MTRLEQYKTVMASLAAGETVSDDDFAAATAFAASGKRKKPVRPTPTKKGSKPKNDPQPCLEVDCDNVAMAKARCSRHYTAWRRQDPTVMEKAREASRRYADRRRQAQAGDAS